MSAIARKASNGGGSGVVQGGLPTTQNGTPSYLFALRMLGVALSDDAMACIDALRRGFADLQKLLPEEEHRTLRLFSQSWRSAMHKPARVDPHESDLLGVPKEPEG